MRDVGREPRRRTGRWVRALAVLMAGALVVGSVVTPAQAESPRDGAAGSLRATDADAVNPTFPLRTRVASAQPVEPGGHLEITVGDQTYPAPTSGAGSCAVRVWVAVLDRASLAGVSSGAYPLCSDADTTQLAATLKGIPNSSIVIVNSLAAPGPHLVLPELGTALAEIGVTAADFASVDLGTTSFSVYGIPGLSAGQAYLNTDDLALESGVAAGEPTGASINGTLAQDNHTNFALTMPDYVLYDIAPDGGITLDGKSYPVPTRPAGFDSGFHVLVVDRRTLSPLSDTLYGNDSAAEFTRMSHDLVGLAADKGRSVMIFLASIGTPTIINGVGGPIDLPKECQATAPFTVTCSYGPTGAGDQGSEQTFVVPASATALRVSAQGGYGGYAKSGGQGGNPDLVRATLPVGANETIKPGQTLYVEVAGEGTSGGNYPGGLGGWNGGAGGGSATIFDNGWPGGGGGGASDIRTVSRAGADGNSAASLASRVVVAAGGGGAGGDAHTFGAGGDGGDAGMAGADGQPNVPGIPTGHGGGPGTSSAGGTAGQGDGSQNGSGDGGSLGVGGAGGRTPLGQGGQGGGGGGGYFGGGGGGGNGGFQGGGGAGGGGSNLVPAGGTVLPVAEQVPAAVTISYLVPEGTLAQALRPFGATPTLINNLSTSPRYALVGALNTPADAAANLSPDSPEASAQISPGATGQLQGVLQRGHDHLRYESVTSNAPVIRSINGQPQPPTVTNYGLYQVVSRVDEPWPVPVATPGPEHDAQAAALKYLSTVACACDNIRDSYNANSHQIQLWRDQIAGADIPAGSGLDPTAFAAVQSQLVVELNDVYSVDALKQGLQTLLGEDNQVLAQALTDAYHDVRDSVSLDDGSVAVSIGNFFLEILLSVTSMIGLDQIAAGVGIVNAALDLGSDLANDANGEHLDALTSTADKLGDDTVAQFEGQLNSLSQTFSLLYGNWGKLSAVANGLRDDNAAWDVDATNAGQYVTATSQAVKLGYYRSLVAVSYTRLEAQSAGSGDMTTWSISGRPPFSAAENGFEIPANAYSTFTYSPAQRFTWAYDNILLRTNHGEPLPAELMTKMQASGAFPPYVFLRWQLPGTVCPLSISTAVGVRHLACDDHDPWPDTPQEQRGTVTISLKDSTGKALAGGKASYYAAGKWRTIGTTGAKGTVSASIPIGKYPFAVTFRGTRQELKATSVTVKASTLSFRTVGVTVRLTSADGKPLGGAKASYYAAGWRTIGATKATTGAVQTQLLPGSYRFALTYRGGKQELSAQTVKGTTRTITVRTAKVTSRTNTAIYYYAAGWHRFTQGMNLLAGRYTFAFIDRTPRKTYTLRSGVTTRIH